MALILFIDYSKPFEEHLISTRAKDLAQSNALRTFSSIFIQEDDNILVMENARQKVIVIEMQLTAWRFPGNYFWRT